MPLALMIDFRSTFSYSLNAPVEPREFWERRTPTGLLQL